MAVEGLGEQVIIAGIVAAVQGIIQFVVGNRVELPASGPAAVVAVDHFPHQPKIGFEGTAVASEGL